MTTTTRLPAAEVEESTRALITQAFRPSGNTVITIGAQHLALVVEKVVGNTLVGELWDDDRDLVVARVAITVEALS